MKTASRPLLAPMREDHITQMTKGNLNTTHALLFHTKGGQLQLVTSHEVRPGGRSASVIQSGRPMTPADERKLVALLIGKGTAEDGVTIYPDRLLFHDTERTIWWMPAAQRPMHLRDAATQVTISTRWPTLVFMAVDRSLFVAAIAEDARPSASTPIFHAPMPNVWPTTQMCTGDATLPLGASISEIPFWEACVLDTAWTHSNHPGALKNTARDKSSADAFWRKRNGNLTPFPSARLNPIGMKLVDWMANVGGDPQ
jgi:PRTRC genetic system protein B